MNGTGEEYNFKYIFMTLDFFIVCNIAMHINFKETHLLKQTYSFQ